MKNQFYKEKSSKQDDKIKNSTQAIIKKLDALSQSDDLALVKQLLEQRQQKIMQNVSDLMGRIAKLENSNENLLQTESTETKEEFEQVTEKLDQIAKISPNKIELQNYINSKLRILNEKFIKTIEDISPTSKDSKSEFVEFLTEFNKNKRTSFSGDINQPQQNSNHITLLSQKSPGVNANGNLGLSSLNDGKPKDKAQGRATLVKQDEEIVVTFIEDSEKIRSEIDDKILDHSAINAKTSKADRPIDEKKLKEEQNWFLKKLFALMERDEYKMFKIVTQGYVVTDSAVASILETFAYENFPSKNLYFSSRMISSIGVAYLLSIRNAYWILKKQNIEEGIIYQVLNVVSQATFTSNVIDVLVGLLQPGELPNTPPYIVEGIALIMAALVTGYFADRESRDKFFDKYAKNARPMVKKVAAVVGQLVNVAGSAQLIIYEVQDILSRWAGLKNLNPGLQEQLIIRAIGFSLPALSFAGLEALEDKVMSKEMFEKIDDLIDLFLSTPFYALWIAIVSEFAYQALYAKSEEVGEYYAYPASLIFLTLSQILFFAIRAYNNDSSPVANNNSDSFIVEVVDDEKSEGSNVIDEKTPLLKEKTEGKSGETKLPTGTEDYGSTEPYANIFSINSSS